MTSYYSTQATFYTFTVFTAIISAFLSFLASLLNYFYSLNKSSQYHLLVTLLILCDGFGSLCFAVWAGIDTFVQHHHDNYLCNIFLPFPTYFFLLSFCWTSLLAYRFRQICEVKDTKQAIDPPLWPVPVLCFFLILPIILMTTLGIKISEPISPISSKGLAFCFFASTRNAFIVNFLTFQFPCILTLLYNIRCFRIGIKFLRLSPERVSSFYKYFDNFIFRLWNVK